MRYEEKLKSFAAELDGDEGLKRKRTKSAADPVLDKAVFSWYSQQRAKGVTISTEILKLQAQKIDNSMEKGLLLWLLAAGPSDSIKDME